MGTESVKYVFKCPCGWIVQTPVGKKTEMVSCCFCRQEYKVVKMKSRGRLIPKEVYDATMADTRRKTTPGGKPGKGSRNRPRHND